MLTSAPSPRSLFGAVCHLCTNQKCKRAGQVVPLKGLACPHQGCPVLNRPSIFSLWWVKALLVLLPLLPVLAAGVYAWGRMEAGHREALRPRVVSVATQDVAWRGQPWEAFVKAEGEGALEYQWYSGLPGDVSTPVTDARASTLRISELETPGRYWVRVSSEYGAADSAGVKVEPDVPDLATHRAELDELISFSRTMLEQRDNVRVIDETYAALNKEQPLGEKERQFSEGMLINSRRKAQEAAALLVEKLLRLRANASTTTVNQLLHDSRPVSRSGASYEEERRRKAFDLIEELWRDAREGRRISDQRALEIADTKLPL